MSTIPLVAALFIRINEEPIAIGNGPIGFENPTLYANPGILNDITVGNQAQGGCRTKLGFSAVEGWDSVTGLGTPRYADWPKVFLALK